MKNGWTVPDMEQLAKLYAIPVTGLYEKPSGSNRKLGTKFTPLPATYLLPGEDENPEIVLSMSYSIPSIIGARYLELARATKSAK
jgi:hypothetical protein